MTTISETRQLMVKDGSSGPRIFGWADMFQEIKLQWAHAKFRKWEDSSHRQHVSQYGYGSVCDYYLGLSSGRNA